MKKWILLLLCVLFVGLLVTANAETVGGTAFWTYGYGFDGGSKNIFWSLDLSTGTMRISGTGGWGNYWLGHVPWGEGLGRYLVSGDEYAPAKDYRSSIKTVIIEDGVTSIADLAFNGCGNLLSVTIPESVTHIGESAFNGCSSLTTIKLPSKLKTIANSAFKDCTALQTCNIPATVSSIGEEAFRKTTSLRQMVCYGDLGNKAFYESGIRSIEVHNCSVIGEQVFYECKNLSSASLLCDITKIPVETFRKCSSLTKVNIPATVTSIEESAFENDTALTSISIPDSVNTIGYRAFAGSGLLSVTIPDSVAIMDIEVFQYCTNLQKATLSSQLGTIPKGTFYQCTSLMNVTIPEGPSILGEYALQNCSSLTSLTLPESIQIIQDRALDGCKALGSISMSDKVSSIGEKALGNCSSLTVFSVPGGVNMLSRDVLVSSGIKALVLPASVTTIDRNALGGCKNLQNVFYEGSEQDRSAITIGKDNDQLGRAIWHYQEKVSLKDISNIWKTTYKWNDDFSEVTGTAVCAFKSSHTITETVERADSRTIREATCVTEGEVEYTSKRFDNSLFSVQKTTASLPMKSHNWKDPEYTWSDDNSKVTAVVECREGDHPETETVGTTYQVIKDPDFQVEGEGLYTSAAFKNDLFSIQEKRVSIPALTERVRIDEENFPDKNFRDFVTRYDKDKSGRLGDEELEAVTEMDCGRRSIASLKGIGFFSKLTKLDCAQNELTSLDLSQLTLLEELRCGNNKIKELDLSSNTALKDLNCEYNELQSLIVSGCENLTHIVVWHNQLSELNLNQNTELVWLDASNNQLTALDVSENTKLETLYTEHNKLSELDVSNCTVIAECVQSRPRTKSDKYDCDGYTPAGSIYFRLLVDYNVKVICDNNSQADPLPGDVNEDGVVDGRDVIRLMKYLADEIDETTNEIFEINTVNSDVNKDDKVDELDLLRLMKYLSGAISALQ